MMKFASKGTNLYSLKKIIKTAYIADSLLIKVSEWETNKQEILDKIKKKFNEQKIIVRSSCKDEDNNKFSNAGAFKSILNVEQSYISQSIEEVIKSYKSDNKDNEVLIQNMLKNVVCSGVALSHDPNTCSPYRVINYSIGDDTTCVTAGKGGLIWQQAANSKISYPQPIQSVGVLLDEILEIFDNKPIDLEFAITEENQFQKLWLLQVRPLVLRDNPETEESQSKRLENISTKISKGLRQHPFLKGKSTIYGVMPDWNPAEIVGIRPNPLALSLYRELVTDSIWAYQRHNYGYRNLRSFPLMVSFCGLPYIDVRLSFNSFIPSSLDDFLAERLVDHYLEKLLLKPELHDKVEFEIVHSCYTFDLNEKLQNLPRELFSPQEIEKISNSLRDLTTKVISPSDGLWKEDSKKIEILNKRREELLENITDPISRIYWLVEDTKRYGTLPFAGLARAGFIAVQMLKSLLSVGIISNNDYDCLMANVSTVGKKLNRDRANLDKQTFLSRYGHLRPGTYDILSARYDEKPDLYFNWEENKEYEENINPFSLTLNQISEIAKNLEDHKLNIDAVSLLNFIKDAIELRELSKFHFTRNLSDVLSLIGEVGSRYDFSLEDLSFCNINCFKELYISSNNTGDIIKRSIEEGRKFYEETKKTSLPPLIKDSNDAWGFELRENQPNFITQKSIKGKVCLLNNIDNLNGSIICIPNADPGFDWIFSHKIAGLITAWGGVNSHMAIRSGEIGLPAVIGAGEILYKKWSTKKKLHINCAGRYVEILQ